MNKKLNMNGKSTHQIIGWYGMTAILLAYALLNFNVFSTSSFWYLFMNGTGSLGIGYISFKKKAYQPFVLNIIWTIITLIALFKLIS